MCSGALLRLHGTENSFPPDMPALWSVLPLRCSQEMAPLLQ